MNNIETAEKFVDAVKNGKNVTASRHLEEMLKAKAGKRIADVLKS